MNLSQLQHYLPALLPAALGIGFFAWKRRPRPGVQRGELPADPMAAQAWDIGPTIEGVNYSAHMPLHPLADPEGLAIELFQSNQELHYFTRSIGPLPSTGKPRAVVSVQCDPGAYFEPVTAAGSPATMMLHFQRAGDDWTPSHEAFRWYAKFAQVIPLVPGEYVLEAPLEGDWNAAQVSTRQSNPAAFKMALANAARAGIVFGGGTGAGHGVRMVGGRGRIVLKSFKVE